MWDLKKAELIETEQTDSCQGLRVGSGGNG